MIWIYSTRSVRWDPFWLWRTMPWRMRRDLEEISMFFWGTGYKCRYDMV